MSTKQIPVGIDLGTTFSAIAHLDNAGRPLTIPNSEGELTTPSVVFFDHDGVIVGTEAALAGEIEPERQAKLAKRDMGGTHFSKKILGRQLPPEVIQSYVLDRLKKDASLKIGDVTKAVITVPAYFNEPRRKATQDAGQIAGLDVIDIINEPTAAALAYGVQRGFLNEKGEACKKELVLVYDLGGGTFDVTLMGIDGSDFTALATAGDVYLGGVDWDQRLFNFASAKLKTDRGLVCSENDSLSEKLLRECTRAKKTLAARNETSIRLEHHGQRFKLDVTRDQFEELTLDLLERTRLTADLLLKDAGLDWSSLTRLLLVGGSTRMPMVGNMLEKESGLPVDRSLSPDESIAHGAAIYAGILMNQGTEFGAGISVQNINSHDLGVLGIDPKTKKPKRQIIIPRNHRIPATEAKKFQTSKDNQRRILVQVVEGGTSTGEGSTTIGKCIVDDLPAGLEKGTSVVVQFRYDNSGRLQVVADIPSLERNADSSIDRARGMSAEKIEQWTSDIKLGLEFPDAEGLAGTPTPEVEATAETVARQSIDEQPANENESIPQIVDVDIPAHKQDAPSISQLNLMKEAQELDKMLSEEDVEALDEFFRIDADPKPLAGESVLDFLGEAPRKKASASDTALRNFLNSKQ